MQPGVEAVPTANRLFTLTTKSGLVANGLDPDKVVAAPQRCDNNIERVERAVGLLSATARLQRFYPSLQPVGDKLCSVVLLLLSSVFLASRLMSVVVCLKSSVRSSSVYSRIQL
jgi:hypothetical protein